MVIVAKVAINGATFPFVMIKPLKAPRIRPRISVIPMETIGSVPPANKLAATAPVNARVEPTDKSMPPVRMTKVIPKAIMALIDTCLNTLKMLEIAKKLGFRMLTTIIRRINPINGPSFEMISFVDLDNLFTTCCKVHDSFLSHVFLRNFPRQFPFMHDKDAIGHSDDFRKLGRNH